MFNRAAMIELVNRMEDAWNVRQIGRRLDAIQAVEALLNAEPELTTEAMKDYAAVARFIVIAFEHMMFCNTRFGG